MQMVTVSDTTTRPAGPGAHAGLVLVPAARPTAGPATAAARARVRHALIRTVQEFLDRAGFTELDRAPGTALAAQLGRVCWTTREGMLVGLLDGADGGALIDLLERALLAALHGTLSRAAADLQALDVDLDRLKYLRLPVRRLRQEDAARRGAAGWPGAGSPVMAGGADRERRLLAEAGEPILLLQYAAGDDEDAAAGSRLREARLLLPEVGCVAGAGAGGRFHLDLPALARFLCLARVAVLARPALTCAGNLERGLCPDEL